jgi:hypothetical protein
MSRRSSRSRKNVESSGPSGLGSPSEYSPVAPVGYPTSSLGIRERSSRIAPGTAHPPPPTCHRASTPARALRPVPRFRGNHPRNPVPSSWFRTTSTVSSARRSRACCIPLPVLGFVAFRDHRVPGRLLDESRGRRECRLPPRDDFTPLEGFPSTTAAPRHRGRCPLAVPPDPARRLRPPPLPESTVNTPLDRIVGFEALLRHRVRNVRPIVANRETSSPSWASFPFKVLPDDETNPRLVRRTVCSRRPPFEGTTLTTGSSVSTPVIDCDPEGPRRPGSTTNAEALAGLTPRGPRPP